MIPLLLPILLLATYPLRPTHILQAPGHAPPASPTIIPASREHPGAAESCPLDLPEDFFHSVSAVCMGSTTTSRDQCCPALAAWLYAAYSSVALETRIQPSAARSDDELPVLPGEAEQCAEAAEGALRVRGVVIPGANDTCGAASCACSVRLHPLQCPGPFVVAGGEEGRWVPMLDVAERLEVGCARPGIAGCSNCLRALYQLKNKDSGKGSTGGENAKAGRECHLMGLTWLLYKNRTRYLPAAAYVFRAFRAADAGGGYPATCSIAGELPLPVGYEQLLGSASCSAGGGLSPLTPAISIFLMLIHFIYVK